ncbi:MAG: hypothetical protein UR88_C0018G0008 [Candidatus Nomurabacteria bacterium GW2011_GWA1_35_8]|uniref:Uncharacterized protein n=1 Tax=Candidatus Nomurabacteria bacterium GW2011_GWA1_35_8 TaxID=1618727 RepID=A0A0G0G0U1_9BACT|nr:MAG: hypothetical protein UR88_C0018G0008 [Candidatus Nomurabacteria bacterium GW2011_GWA1_35_8]
MLLNRYHEDFFTPGIWPFDAVSLKQILQIPKSLIYPRFLPHLKQRRTMRVEYFGFFLDLAITDVLAMFLERYSQ